MADISRSKSQESDQQDEAKVLARRAFVRRAAMVGLPAVLATVQPRTAWATGGGNGNKPSAVGSARPSGKGRGPGGGNAPGWTRPEGWSRGQ